MIIVASAFHRPPFANLDFSWFSDDSIVLQ